MNIILYGTGDLGRKFYEKVNSQYMNEDIQVVGYADTYRTGTYMDLPIVDIEDVEKYGQMRIVICIIHMEFAFSVYRRLRDLKYEDIYLYRGNDENFSKNLWNGECKKLDKESIGEHPLPHLELQLADWCNLNCRGCNHYSPLYEHIMPDRHLRIKDVRTIKTIFSYVGRIYLLGGEPFLNPEVKEYIKDIREIYPDVDIVIMTNGLLIPDLPEEVFECIHDNHVIVQVSEYDITDRVLDKIIALFKEYQIDYNIEYNSRKKVFFQPLSLRTDSEYKSCNARGCNAVRDGKIARCPQLLYVPKINERFALNLPEDGIVDLHEGMDPEQLLEKLHKKVPLCDHCTSKPRPWKSCGNNPIVDDFVDIQ